MLDDLVKIFDSFSKGGRAQDLEQFAKEHEYQFSERQTLGSQRTAIKYFKLFSRKGSKRLIGIINTNFPDIPAEMRFYDFLITKDLETKTSSIIEVDCPELYFDPFHIRPRKGLKLGPSKAKKMGVFPDFKEFHHKFSIQFEDEYKKPILNRTALEMLLDFPKIHVEGNGNTLIFYRRNKETPLQDIQMLMNMAEDFTRALFSFDSEDYV